MGTDIHGYVEIRESPERKWKQVINIEDALPRNYDMFGMLFGVRNYVQHDPLFYLRGLPSDFAYKDEAYFGHSETHAYLHEFEDVDWDKAATDTRVSVAIMDEHGWEVCFKGSGTQIPELKPGDNPIIENGRKFFLSENTRRDCAGDSFFELLERMREYGVQCGTENVRIVVWFDS